MNATPAVHTHTGDEAAEAMDDNEQPPFTTPTAQLSQQELHSIYAGADGVMDEVEEIMMKYDADQSGCFSVAEVKAIIQDQGSGETRESTWKQLPIITVNSIIATN
ncbi:unnamed protein product [Polarella glacialis]|uniref:EF-hand domain-containing protein n=1 Tax=Polarella glacialis TaxID=89957 RepID=A0A813JXY7_POLGL|nr:unnamed protein product [Polarella glacialis]